MFLSIFYKRFSTTPKPSNDSINAYLLKIKKNKNFMQNEELVYQKGRKYLARMFGEDEENFDDQKMNSAIKYLFPSMLYSVKARPILGKPSLVYPEQKILDIDLDGRPKNSFFYTGNPKFFEICYKALQLSEFSDHNKEISIKSEINDSNWIDKTSLERKIKEEITDKQYLEFIQLMDTLLLKPITQEKLDFSLQFRQSHKSQLSLISEKAMVEKASDDTFKAYGQKKNSFAECELKFPGSGKFTVDGKPLRIVFPNISDREQILFPLHLLDLTGKVDVSAKLSGPYGNSSKSNSLRLAVARALSVAVEDESSKIKLELAGLLTEDWRTVERNKPGRRGPRRPPIWKAR